MHPALPKLSRRAATLFLESFFIALIFSGFLSGIVYIACTQQTGEPAISVTFSSDEPVEDGKRHPSGGADAFSLGFLGWKMEISSEKAEALGQSAQTLYHKYGVLIPAGWRALGSSVYLAWRELTAG